MALSGFDVALWALAIAAGLPLATLLGAKPKPIPAYNSSGLGLMSPEAAADEAEKLLTGGFSAVKLRLGHPKARAGPRGHPRSAQAASRRHRAAGGCLTRQPPAGNLRPLKRTLSASDSRPTPPKGQKRFPISALKPRDLRAGYPSNFAQRGWLRKATRGISSSLCFADIDFVD